MAAINALVARDVAGQLIKRKNWAAREPGVIVVFCIVFIGTSPRCSVGPGRATRAAKPNQHPCHSFLFPSACTDLIGIVVAVGLIILWIFKILQRRKAAKSEFS
jgi:hypothetical protein